MNWKHCTVGLALILAASLPAAAVGQVTGGQLRDMIIEDSLTPAKTQLRNYVAELRDTLNYVEALQASITRNRASGASAVVLSNGRQLGRRCRDGGAAADLLSQRVGVMRTSDPRGDQALNAFRASLAELMQDLQACQHDDSVVMAAAKPDPNRIEQVATAAGDAITRYNSVRDGLMRLLNINLPIKGTIRAPKR